MKPFERRHIPLKSSGQHGKVNSLSFLYGADEKSSCYADKYFDTLPALSIRPHISGADNSHRFFYKHENITVKKKKL